jgi:hypothetical protein
MDKDQAEKETTLIGSQHDADEQTRRRTQDGELISLGFIDPALAAKVSLLNDVRNPPHFYR